MISKRTPTMEAGRRSFSTNPRPGRSPDSAAEAAFPPEATVRVPIGDELNLHASHPGEVAELLDDYFQECVAAEIQKVRAIHGKAMEF
jgi:hypothetical protein